MVKRWRAGEHRQVGSRNSDGPAIGWVCDLGPGSKLPAGGGMEQVSGQWYEQPSVYAVRRCALQFHGTTCETNNRIGDAFLCQLASGPKQKLRAVEMCWELSKQAASQQQRLKPSRNH